MSEKEFKAEDMTVWDWIVCFLIISIGIISTAGALLKYAIWIFRWAVQ